MKIDRKYVAKYVSVKGNVKEGDNYQSKWRSENKFYHYSTCAKIENYKVFPTDGAGKDSGFPLEDIVSKVEMFLFLNEEGNEAQPIGKISPEANWLLHRDTIDDDRIQYWYLMGDTLIQWKEGDPERWKINPLTIIKIKGPCGHFH